MRWTRNEVTVEAEQFHIGTEFKAPWIYKAIEDEIIFFIFGEMAVRTNNGLVIIEDGDYIILDGLNEIYPCKPITFHRNYSYAKEEEEGNKGRD